MDTIKDETFDKITEITTKDRQITEDFVNKVVELLKEKLADGQDEFDLKHGFLGLSKCIISLAQTLCDSEEHYMEEINKAQSLAIGKMINSILPVTDEEGKIEENYDSEDLSIRRLMMAVGTLIDYVFWRTEISKYSQKREEIENENVNSTSENSEV